MKMKKMKKAAILLVAMLMATVLGGCGSFDASGYIKALLDNSYKNDSAAFVEQKIGTKEEASELYELGIENALKSLTSGTQISDELQQEYETVVRDIYKSVKYTVGEATKKDDGSYEVEVKYQKMKVFSAAMEKYEAASDAYVQEMTEKVGNGEEGPSEEEALEQSFSMLKDAIQESLGNVEYEDEQSATVRVELKDKVYTPNEDDVFNLEQKMFDIEAVTEAQ
ncbi:hypothetical protein D3Z36_14020 [Lachnospiraceae bacterium]|nr:hypothetical protein [Lachnospiraceae bacterium]